jgi:hypothetical protein
LRWPAETDVTGVAQARSELRRYFTDSLFAGNADSSWQCARPTQRALECARSSRCGRAAAAILSVVADIVNVWRRGAACSEQLDNLMRISADKLPEATRYWHAAAQERGKIFYDFMQSISVSSGRARAPKAQAVAADDDTLAELGRRAGDDAGPGLGSAAAAIAAPDAPSTDGGTRRGKAAAAAAAAAPRSTSVSSKSSARAAASLRYVAPGGPKQEESESDERHRDGPGRGPGKLRDNRGGAAAPRPPLRIEATGGASAASAAAPGPIGAILGPGASSRAKNAKVSVRNVHA